MLRGAGKIRFGQSPERRAIAETGDRVIVHEGVYREWVKPAHTGYSNISRITYEAAEGEKVVIKGFLKGFRTGEQTEGTVWKAVVPNTLFGDYNPYQEILGGDWFLYPCARMDRRDTVSIRGVYLNGEIIFEAKSLEDEESCNSVRKATIRRGQNGRSLSCIRRIPFTSGMRRWMTKIPIYANFQGADPNRGWWKSMREMLLLPGKAGDELYYGTRL